MWSANGNAQRSKARIMLLCFGFFSLPSLIIIIIFFYLENCFVFYTRRRQHMLRRTVYNGRRPVAIMTSTHTNVHTLSHRPTMTNRDFRSACNRLPRFSPRAGDGIIENYTRIKRSSSTPTNTVHCARSFLY